jgi:hypothetical protein
VGRQWLGPVGDGDDSAEGRPARALVAALGAEATAAAWNKKMKLSQSEMCGVQGETSSVLLRKFEKCRLPRYIRRLTDEYTATYIRQLTDECTEHLFLGYLYLRRFRY